MKTLAIMQPYFFPYIGYWQLIKAVDRFILYDDVNFIKRGWVNRNRILIQGAPAYITAPLLHASSHQYISSTMLVPGDYWRDKLVRTISNTYRRAPFFNGVFPIVEQLIKYKTDCLSEYLAYQIQILAEFMSINTEIVTSRCSDENLLLSGQERIIDICQREQVCSYINLPSGRMLYEPQRFAESGLDLSFIDTRSLSYPQPADTFVSRLSIIDVLMSVGPFGIKDHLNAYDISSSSLV